MNISSDTTFSPFTAEITIDALGGLGDGIANLNGKPLFVAKSCPGDRLEVQVTHETRDKYQGVINRVIAPGLARQFAPCAHFNSCGGCTMQQLTPEYYRQFKTKILHRALAQAGFAAPESQVLFIPAHTRRRVEFKIATNAGKATLAFHALRSHTPVFVTECPVLHPQLQSLIEPLSAALRELSFCQYIYSASLTLADSGIDLILTLKDVDIDTHPSLDILCKELPFARVSVRLPDGNPKVVCQNAPVEMQLGGYSIPLPPGAFLQASEAGQAALTEAALQATAGAGSVVDLFCGVGTYSFPLSLRSKTHAVEGEGAMIQAIREGVSRHKIANLSYEQRDLFKRPLTSAELSHYDAAVINPPRLGAKAQTEQLAQSQLNTIIMISCNPATFSRDAALLHKTGFKLAHAQGIDQFLWSQHLEIVAVFRR